MTISGRPAIILIVCISIWFTISFFRVGDDQNRKFDDNQLRQALVYIDKMSRMDAPRLFSSNARNFQKFGDIATARSALVKFRNEQSVSFFSIIGNRNDIIVLPRNLENLPITSALTAIGVPIRALRDILSSTRNSGCFAAKLGQFDWVEYGYVFADAAVLEDIEHCIGQGLAFLNGLPMAGDKFEYQNSLTSDISALLVHYAIECAYAGVTDRNPAWRSNSRITTRPSISCIADNIRNAITK